MKGIAILMVLIFTLFSNANNVKAQDVVDATTMNNKIMAGYQGWFGAPGDGSGYGWIHWGGPNADNITFDMWPDMREYEEDELFTTEFVYRDLNKAKLFSSYTKKTVIRHIKWMKDYGIDGAFVQRFISSAISRQAQRDTVLQNVRYGAEEHGRVFANMYDMSGGKPESFDEDVKKDWMHLVDDLKITESPNYLHHNGKPVLSLWGVHAGNSKDDLPVEKWAALVEWLTVGAEEKYQVTLKAGVGNDWKLDTKVWQDVYDAFDFISPWAVGRYNDNDGADNYRNKYFQADLDETESRDMEYIPVVFPGFSWANLYPGKELNQIPRNGGKFYWRQLYNAVDAGCNMIYIAMYDEVDEGTAIFKLAENESQIPTTGKFVTLDADGYKLPSDWYLKLTGEAGKMLRGEIPLTSTIPIVAYPNNSKCTSQELNTIMAPDATQEVSITMKNTGTTTWTKTDNYKLVFDSSAGSNYWGVNEIELDDLDTIAPGESKTFTFNITAPANESVFPFQWRMKQDGVDWIGDASKKGLVNVGTDITFFDDCNALTDWNSSTTLNLNSSNQIQGSGCIEFIGSAGDDLEFEKVFATPYNSGLNEYDAVLQFWYFVSNDSLLKSKTKIGLGSAGNADENEFYWTVEGLSSGWNLISLNIDEAEVYGAPDLNSINWFRIHNPKIGEITTRLDEIQILDKNAGATKFTLKVNNGNGTGKYVENAIVRISAKEAPAGQEFIGWTVDSGEPLFENPKAINTSIKITGSNIEVTAEYKLFGTYLDDCDILNGWTSSGAISINSTEQKEGKGCIEFVGQGTDDFKKKFVTPFNSGVTKDNGRLEFWYYTSNASVLGSNQIELGSGGGPDNLEFSWSFQPGELQDGWNFVSLKFSEAGTTGGEPDLSAINHFRMYNYKSEDLITRIDAIEIVDPNAGERRTLTVNGGTGNGNYYIGTKITISADAAPAGQFFDKWEVELGNPEIAELLAQTTTLILPDENVIVRATYKEAGLQKVTVNNGSGSGEFDAGKNIIIIAGRAPSGQEFDKWVINSGTPIIANEFAKLTTLTVGPNDALVTATYKDIATSIEDTENNDFAIYPNPAKNEIFVRCAEMNLKFRILNTLGQQFKVGELENNTINIQNLNKGIYILMIEGYSPKKFVKE